MITTNFQTRRRSSVHAQSLTVAIIVLFLLLFLGGLFIALIVNNMRAGQTAAKGSAADKFAEAGLTYMDDQLTKSPEGADWRPVPFVADPLDTDGNGNYDDQDTNGKAPPAMWSRVATLVWTLADEPRRQATLGGVR
ncbi:MAG: hypothetical protein NTX57_16450 [Armatimonadetes bacterium]|nr:hypothetical protein [Armatimonadota bacterium]